MPIGNNNTQGAWDEPFEAEVIEGDSIVWGTPDNLPPATISTRGGEFVDAFNTQMQRREENESRLEHIRAQIDTLARMGIPRPALVSDIKKEKRKTGKDFEKALKDSYA